MKKLLIACLSLLPLAAAALPQEIFDALRERKVAAVKALVEKSPGVVDSRDGDGLTPLHYAAREGDTELINYLVDRGAKLELQTAQAKTPLHLAAMNDREAAAAVLLKRGAALEARDDYQRTALILCARERGGAGTAGCSSTPGPTSTRPTSSATRRSGSPPGAASASRRPAARRGAPRSRTAGETGGRRCCPRPPPMA